MQFGLAATRAVIVRRAVSCLLTGAMALQMACYSYAPLQTVAPVPPRQVGVVINDRGRTLLGDRVGALVDRIDGQVVSIDSQKLVMHVYRVTDLRGTGSTWTGEEVSIPREGILGFRERKLSKFKVLLLVGVAALAVVGFLGSSLDLFGDPFSDPPDGPPQGTS